MSQIVIDTELIKSVGLYFFAIVGIVSLFVIGVSIVSGHVDQVTATAQVSEPTPIPTPVPAPTPAPPTPAPVVPQTITFTVSSTSMGFNGLYQVFTYSGQLLYVTDYYVWNTITPGSTYTAQISGMANGYNIIVNPVLLYAPEYANEFWAQYPYHYQRYYGASPTVTTANRPVYGKPTVYR
ncbi:MAG: hypothetical protein WB811_03115 [Methanoregula sp.]|uniref:hypothetical protein n=2 Tax=Methanoregula sp. TaxID=2052170 RepID=UPI003BB188CE